MIEVNGKYFEEMIPESLIQSKVLEIASKINIDFAGKEPLFLVVMNGAMFFASDLLQNITLPCEFAAIHAKSYGFSMESTGDVDVYMGKVDIMGKDIIIVEDIIDSGYTLNALKNKILGGSAKSVAIAVLLSKTEMRKVDVEVNYLGFEIPAKFVVGYGLDFAGKGRNYKSIYSLVEK
jgi:hypoxanthine phosphoribosyltransferase